MSENLKTILRGARVTSPLVLGVTPFGLICGAVCVSVGMPEWGAIGLSTIVFAGASQLVATQLMAEHVSVAVVILTGLVINARMFMYSASLAPHWKGLHPLKKAGLAYLLTDQAYAMSITRYNEPDGDTVNKPLFYLGSGLIMWTCFNVTTVLGAYLGAFIPPEWDLGFAIPLTFIALVIPAVKDKPSLLAAVVAGVVALLADGLPYNLGLMTAAAAGICVGYLTERKQTHG